MNNIADDLHDAYETGYREGMSEMFNLITSAWYGKQYYFWQDNGLIYSRKSHKYLKDLDEALYEFLDEVGE